MATREQLLRDLILREDTQLIIPWNDTDRETRKAIRELTEGAAPRADYGAGMLDLTAHPDDERLSAAQQHNVLAAARNILLMVDKPTDEASLAKVLAPRGFTPAQVTAGVNWLRRDGLVARRNGVIHPLVEAPATPPALPPAALAPHHRASATQPAPATRYESTDTDTPRVNTAIPTAAPGLADPLAGLGDSTPQTVYTAAGMGGGGAAASFEVGDIDSAPRAKTTPVEKKAPAPVAVPEGAILTYMGELVDAFARVGKPAAPWAELGVKRPATGDLPDGWTATDVLNDATTRLLRKGTIERGGDGMWTYVPAKTAVAAVRAKHETYLKFMSAETTEVIASDLLSVARDVKAPVGWTLETLHRLSLESLVADGTLIPDGENYRRKPAPVTKPVEKVKVEEVETKPVEEVEGTKTTGTKTAPVQQAPAPAKAVVKTPVPVPATVVATPAPAPVTSTKDTALLVSIDQGVRNLGQVITMQQASAREALQGKNHLHIVLFRVMAVTQKLNTPLNKRDLSTRAFSKREDRDVLDNALEYGVTTGALTRTGMLHGATYTVADPMRVGITWAELNVAAAKVRMAPPKPKPKAS